MVDLGRIVGFDWDDGNSRKSSAKHEVGQREAEQVFADARLLTFIDERHSGSETSFHAFGKSDTGRLLQITFTLRERRDETLIRVISARPMSRKERTRYEEET
jgi:uncharacterized DUF497 family protein